MVTVLSIDGVGAYDHVYLSAVVPFVRATYAKPWEDEAGVKHRMLQAEGGEQGDPLMPLPLAEAQRDCGPQEHLFAFLDDVYATIDVPDRTRTVYDSLGTKLHAQAGIRLHTGKTTRGGVEPRRRENLGNTCGFEEVRSGGHRETIG